MSRRVTRRASPRRAVPEVPGDGGPGDGGPEVPAEDVDDRLAPRADHRRGSASVEPAPRPPVPVNPRDLDRFQLVEPVSLEDLAELAGEVRAMWPGCCSEVYRHRPADPVTVVAWWGDYFKGAIVRRTLVVG